MYILTMLFTLITGDVHGYVIDSRLTAKECSERVQVLQDYDSELEFICEIQI